MGPVRSLYEKEGDLERAFVKQTPMVLRAVHLSDCGERCIFFVGMSAHLCSQIG